MNSDKEPKSQEQKPDDGKEFDMYHFFSRKDLWLAIIVIVVLLIYGFSSHWFAHPV